MGYFASESTCLLFTHYVFHYYWDQVVLGTLTAAQLKLLLSGHKVMTLVYTWYTTYPALYGYSAFALPYQPLKMKV